MIYAWHTKNNTKSMTQKAANLNNGNDGSCSYTQKGPYKELDNLIQHSFLCCSEKLNIEDIHTCKEYGASQFKLNSCTCVLVKLLKKLVSCL